MWMRTAVPAIDPMVTDQPICPSRRSGFEVPDYEGMIG